MTFTYRGEWNPNLTYNGTNDGTVSTGGDEVYWMGALWGATYNTTDSNPFYKTGWSLVSGTVRTDPAVPSWYPSTGAASQASLKLVSSTDHSLTLTWNAALVPGAGEVSSYNVFLDGARVGVTTGTAFTITNLAPGTTHQVSVSATDAYGSSGPDAVMSKGTPSVDLNVSKGANPLLTLSTLGAQLATGKYYSPYIDVGLPGYDLYNVSKASGIKSFTLAFQNGLYTDLNPSPSSYTHTSSGDAPTLKAGLTPSVGFGGLSAVNTPTGALIDEITQIQRSEGGVVTISIGGYTGIDPAVIANEYATYLRTTAGGGLSQAAANAKAAAQLQGEFQSVINTYGVNHLDFDIETEATYTYTDASGNAQFTNDPGNLPSGATNLQTHMYTVANDTAANALRNTALAALEAANPGLGVTFTVATNTTGLGSSTTSYSGNVLGMIQTAIASGVRIDALNLMVMDFDATDTVNGSADQADRAIAAANAVHAQFPSVKIALTPMIGQNDSNSGVTSLVDARAIAAFVEKTPWVVGSGIWQLGRDQAGTAGNQTDPSHPTAVQTYHSGVAQTDWSFSTIFQGTTAINRAATMDFDLDGTSDMLFRNANGTVASWLTTVGPGQAGYTSYGAVSADWKIQSIGDFDGDGKADILWRNDNGEIGAWMSGKGVGGAGYTTLGAAGSDWTIATVGDFDGDGKADIAFRRADGDVAFWNSSKGTGSAGFTDTGVVPSTWKIQGSGDFDGDGKADLLWRNDSGEVGAWLSGKGANNANYTTLGVVGSDWKITAVADFDGDGKADIMFMRNTSQTAFWLSSKGVGSAGFTDLGVIGTQWTSIGATDVDGDGKADALFRNTQTGELGAWESTHGIGPSSFVSFGVVPLDWQAYTPH